MAVKRIIVIAMAKHLSSMLAERVKLKFWSSWFKQEQIQTSLTMKANHLYFVQSRWEGYSASNIYTKIVKLIFWERITKAIILWMLPKNIKNSNYMKFWWMWECPVPLILKKNCQFNREYLAKKQEEEQKKMVSKIF